MAKRDLAYFLGLSYPYQLQAPEGANDLWVASYPDLPGYVAQGEGPKEAIEALKAARRLWIQAAFEKGDPIPLPTTAGSKP